MKDNRRRISPANRILRYLMIAAVIFLQYVQLQYSVTEDLPVIFTQDLRVMLLNMAFLGALTMALSLVLQSMTFTLLLSSLAVTLWSIANHYVILFHGSPLFPSELLNFQTAMNVTGGYRFEISSVVICLVGLFAGEVVLVLLHHLLCREKGLISIRSWFLHLLVLALLSGLFYLGMFSRFRVVDETVLSWLWSRNIETSGFCVCSVENLKKMLYPYRVPEGYADTAIKEEPAAAAGTAKVQPDVILILNETFCDLDYYSDVQADSGYLDDFYALKNASFGHALVSLEGGGTNNSEYELLTSNSMYLLNNDAPFNYVDLASTDAQAAAYFHALGYETYAMHCGTPENYARDKAYPGMGFDHILLGKEVFSNHHSYGNRNWLDEDSYLELERLYEEDTGKPKFMYLLTFQNHGGYEKNDPSMDTVHTTKDLGDVTDDVDEFLTSISISAEAFLTLTAYFEKADRPVIICMVGDHAPSFVGELPSDPERTEEEAALAKRVVPYVIWSNFDADLPENGLSATMTDLLPMTEKAAGLPLTKYGNTILALQEEVPFRSAIGLYETKDGEIFSYEDENPLREKLLQYFYLEYNGLRAGSDYHKEYFLPE
ncbi:MAG: LTA synthase family protein [Blautia sp.]|nr:LTA synthase family protein [Blautia sp.]